MKSSQNDVWYHGSPYQITQLLTGSTITQDIRLAEVFSHKPSIVSMEDNGCIRHDGRLPGYLYVVDETITPDDISLVPYSTMQQGKEFLIKRNLSVRCLHLVPLHPNELLLPEEVGNLIKNSH